MVRKSCRKASSSSRFGLGRLSQNPWSEVISVMELIRIYWAERPDIVHHVAMKAALYGTMAARLVRSPAVINAFTGLGYTFSSSQTHARVLKALIRAAFRLILNGTNGRIGVIVQNPDDRELLVKANILKRDNGYLIKGSGVDPEDYAMNPEPPGIPRIILASRMIWDKGIGEFVRAARQLLDAGVKARFILSGIVDSGHPSAIPVGTLQGWHEEGTIEWWGYRENMPAILSQAHVVCLPSFYGEGVPKVLIEAASCGRAIVTTDAPGCREIVRDGENGFLVPPHDVEALAGAIRRLIDDPPLRKAMGQRGRKLVIEEFSLDRVVSDTMGLYEKMLVANRQHASALSRMQAAPEFGK